MSHPDQCPTCSALVFYRRRPAILIHDAEGRRVVAPPTQTKFVCGAVVGQNPRECPEASDSFDLRLGRSQ